LTNVTSYDILGSNDGQTKEVKDMALFKSHELKYVAKRFGARFIFAYSDKERSEGVNNQIGWWAKEGFTKLMPAGKFNRESGAWEVSSEDAKDINKFLGISW
jgi:hypothetical protein